MSFTTNGKIDGKKFEIIQDDHGQHERQQSNNKVNVLMESQPSPSVRPKEQNSTQQNGLTTTNNQLISTASNSSQRQTPSPEPSHQLATTIETVENLDGDDDDGDNISKAIHPVEPTVQLRNPNALAISNLQTTISGSTSSFPIPHQPERPKSTSLLLKKSNKRFKQIWFAFKRLSPMHYKPNRQNDCDNNLNNLSDNNLNNENNLGLCAESNASTNNSTWSPFTQWKNRHSRLQKQNQQTALMTIKNRIDSNRRAYSTPDISFQHLNELDKNDLVVGCEPEDFEDDDIDLELIQTDSGEHLHPNRASTLKPRLFSHGGHYSSPIGRLRKKIKRDMQRCIRHSAESDNSSIHPLTTTDADSDCQISEQETVINQKSNMTMYGPVASMEETQKMINDHYSRSSKSPSPAPVKHKRSFLMMKAKAKTIETTTASVSVEDSLDPKSTSAQLQSIKEVKNTQQSAISIQPEGTQTEVNNNKKISINQEEIMRLQRIHTLLQYPFFLVDVHLKHGQNLLAKDTCGTSDPYVKFKIGNQVVHRSQTKFKTLNPTWDEYFVFPIDNICEPLVIKVYDYDYFFMDDFLGTTQIDLTRLEPGITTDLELCLHDESSLKHQQQPNLDVSGTVDSPQQSETQQQQQQQEDSSWGKIFLTVRLNPKTQGERENYYGRGKWTTVPGVDGQSNKRIKSQPYDSIVSIVLIKGDHMDMDNDYCIRFKLATEKFKSKMVSKNVHTPYFAEQFEMHLFADQSKVLEITLALAQHQQNYNEFVDKVCIDLSQLETERTHKFTHRFNCLTMKANQQSNNDQNNQNTTNLPSTNQSFNGQGFIEMLLTITGIHPNHQPQQLTQQQTNNDSSAIVMNNNQNLEQIIHCSNIQNSSYLGWNDLMNVSNLYENLFDVGTLIVKVYKAENLAAADINGKSDPFCVLELVNERLRTSTEYKTLSPEWNKCFKFQIKDIHDVLEVTIYDEDKDRVEFLGKVAIPLLKIKNGERRWYALKDKKLRTRVKGHIFMECWISYSKLKASVLTFTPKPTKYIQTEVKFKRSLFIKNAFRLKNICMELVEIGQFLHSCIQWESPTRSIIAFISFLSSVYYFELYMIPLFFLLYILMNYLTIKMRNYFNTQGKDQDLDDYIDERIFEAEDFDEKAEEKKSLKQKLHTMQEISTLVMTIIGHIASYFERIKNTTNFTVPYLSWLAVICLSATTFVLYFIPIRYIILIWGINKFTKKFRSPDAINNNEIIDFLSRVPDMEEKIMYKEFKPTINDDNVSSGHQQLNRQQSGSPLPPAINLNRRSSSTLTLDLDPIHQRRPNQRTKTKKK